MKVKRALSSRSDLVQYYYLGVDEYEGKNIPT